MERKQVLSFLKRNYIEILVVIFSLVFSTWLMFSTFSYQDGAMLIASKAWSDFASHIPLIRSFSFGNNFPPQFPLFAGPPIHYHFLFYMFIGILEKFGVRIDVALNSLSILGFMGLLLAIYFFAKTLFSSKGVAILSIIFFLFNGTFSFLYFLQDHPISPNFIFQMISNKTFPSFAPYGGGVVSAFWNLNIYTNQRHLGASYALSLLLIFILILPIIKNIKLNIKLSFLIGAILGASFFLHMAVFFMTVVLLLLLFLLFPKIRLTTFITATIGILLALSQFWYINSSESSFKMTFFPGYLIGNNLTPLTFATYWFANLGLHSILIPLGFIFASQQAKKILLAFASLFIIGNLFQFSPEMAANHKFFNYFMIIGNIFSAFFLVFLWKKNIFLKSVVFVLIFFLTFSGIIDFFPIYNDQKLAVPDYKKNQDIAWIIKNTPKNSVFLTTNYLYDPASLAGRKLFLGWPYFAWSQGYDTHLRGKLRDNIFTSKSKNFVCNDLFKKNIDYIGISNLPVPDPNTPPISIIFPEQFFQEHENHQSAYTIYNVKKSCRL